MASMEPEVHVALRCPVGWGSHGCHRTRGHEGNHACIGENGCGGEVGRDGKDESGFQWDLHTPNPCDKFVCWWDGEYEGHCERFEDHEGPHFDGLSWFDDDGDRADDPADSRPAS